MFYKTCDSMLYLSYVKQIKYHIIPSKNEPILMKISRDIKIRFWKKELHFYKYNITIGILYNTPIPNNISAQGPTYYVSIKYWKKLNFTQTIVYNVWKQKQHYVS